MHGVMSSLFALLILVSPGQGGHGADSGAFAAALEAARDDPQLPLDIDVDCTDGTARRSLEVINGAVAILNNEVQVRLDAAERTSLIDLLAGADFANFDERYGEVRNAEKQEAPLRVSCRVRAEIGGVTKSSAQLFDGEQSEKLLRLAGALIDTVEPRAAGGETAHSIEDGLAKISAGELAPEVLQVRWLSLPGTEHEQPGLIVRIRRGRIERQAYTPGVDIGGTTSRALTPSQLQTLIRAFEDAEFWQLPLNLEADGLNEIQVSILAQTKTVIARPGFKAATAEQQTAFAKLLSGLAELPTGR